MAQPLNALELVQAWQLGEAKRAALAQEMAINNAMMPYKIEALQANALRDRAAVEHQRNALAADERRFGMQNALQRDMMASRERQAANALAAKSQDLRFRAEQARQKADADARMKSPEAVAEREAAKERGKIAMKLPEAIASTEQTIEQIDALIGDESGSVKEHPGFRGAVGVSGIGSGFGVAGFLPGTDVTDFKRRLDQIKGGAFMEAFNTLKGGGQITEKEGEKATQAITRMDTSQSEKEFVAAAREFQKTLRGVINRAKSRQSPSRPQQPQAGGGFRVLGIER